MSTGSRSSWAEIETENTIYRLRDKVRTLESQLMASETERQDLRARVDELESRCAKDDELKELVVRTSEALEKLRGENQALSQSCQEWEGSADYWRQSSQATEDLLRDARREIQQLKNKLVNYQIREIEQSKNQTH